MIFRHVAWVSFVISVLGTGCDPYDRDGEYNAGPVDPANFPPEYLGTSIVPADGRTVGNRLRVGASRFIANRAYVNGAPVGFYMFSFTPTQLAQADPARIITGGRALVDSNTGSRVVANAYVFDSEPPSPFPSSPQCQPPSSDYTYQPNQAPSLASYGSRGGDGLNYGEQGNIFTVLPSVGSPDATTYLPGRLPSTGYAPIVSETRVSSNQQPCQSIKSEKTLLGNTNVTLDTPERYLAWAIIDPSAAVYVFNTTPPGSDLRGGIPAGGIGLQKWGWFKHYFLAYLDGGYISFTDSPGTGGINRRLTPQVLYLPSAVSDASTINPAGESLGYGVLQAKRNDAGYSPICQIKIYNTGPLPPTRANLPKSEAQIILTYGPTFTDPVQGSATVRPSPLGVCPPGSPTGSVCPVPRFVYCLQVQ